jgi:hypothetical protein
MQHLTIILLMLAGSASQAQVIVHDAGMVNAVINIKNKDGSQVSETKLTTTYQKENIKIESKSAMSVTTAFVNLNEKKVTTINQVMGKKLGFVIKSDPVVDSFSIQLIDSTKTFNGFSCKKAIIKYNRQNDNRNPVSIWYSTEHKFVDSTLGLNISGVGSLPGFPITIETTIPQGYYLMYYTTSIKFSNKINPEEFIIPKDYEISSITEYRRKVKQLSQ